MGGFQFEYYPVPRPAINESIDEHLTKILPHVDLYGSAWYGATLEKRLLGMNFLEVLVQADGVLVTFHVPRAETSLLWSLFSPFTLEVWIFIALVIVVNAVFYWLVEKPVTKDGSRISSLFYSLYLSMGVFLCIESMEPKKIPTRILNAVYSFFKLIILTLYTGKLADILIGLAAPRLPEVLSMDDANMRGLDICALANIPYFLETQNLYSRVQMVPIYSTEYTSLFQAMKAGLCMGAVIPKGEYELVLSSKKCNPICDLVQVGPRIFALEGSWPYLANFHAGCNHLMDIVLSTLLLKLETEGFLKQAYMTSLTNFSDSGCPEAQDYAPASQLGVSTLSGLFVIYGAVMILTVGIDFVIVSLKGFYDVVDDLVDDDDDDELVSSGGVRVSEKQVELRKQKVRYEFMRNKMTSTSLGEDKRTGITTGENEYDK